MSNPTSNFNWQMPTSSDLVTDLPADFEVFGQAVDTTLADLKGGTTGQILSKASNTDMDFTWTSANPGDITGVSVTSPITGGGTSGDVTIGIASSAIVPSQTGNSGKYLTTDGTTSSWATPSLSVPNAFFAGKNKIQNGDFFINQRAFTSTTTDGDFGFDRFKMLANGGATMSAQTFTPGTAPVSGYEARNYCRIVTTGQSGSSVYTLLQQGIEDVRTFAGQTVVLSFWAKAASGTPKIAANIEQVFGTGGSPSATVKNYAGQATLSTSWARYSLSVTMPSLSGKTIGTTANTSYLAVRLWVSAGSSSDSETGTLGIQSNTFDIWGVQLEAGSTATDFQTATGSIAGELAVCQRYYQRSTSSGDMTAPGLSAGSTQAYFTAPLVVQMRRLVSLDYSSPQVYTGNAFGSVSSISLQSSDTSRLQLNVIGSGFGTWGMSLMFSVTYLAANGEF